MANIAFLGTGLLGSAFAEAAAKRGDTVTAWNRSPGKVLAFAQFGVKAATTPAEAAGGRKASLKTRSCQWLDKRTLDSEWERKT